MGMDFDSKLRYIESTNWYCSIYIYKKCDFHQFDKKLADMQWNDNVVAQG